MAKGRQVAGSLDQSRYPGHVRAVGACSPARSRVRFGHIWIDALTFPEALAEIDRLVVAGPCGCCFTPHADPAEMAEVGGAFLGASAAPTLSLTAGQPPIWASRPLAGPLPA